MARQTSRSRTVREDAPLAADRPVQIESQRRFFSNRGNDSASRTARALIDTFSSGIELKQTLDVKANVEGREQATTDRAQGIERDEANKNAGYDAKWQQMDAEHDFNQIRKDLPKFLEDNNAELMARDDVSTLINDYYLQQLKGLDPTTAYGRAIAPALLQLEQDQLGLHDDEQIAQIRAEQRVTMSNNLQERYNETGEFDYDYNMDMTNTFLDNEAKRVAHAENIFLAAERAGDVSIIDNAPQQFPDGSQTGFGDPAGPLADEIKAARRAAMVKAASLQTMRDEALDDQANAQRLDAQLTIWRVGSDGGDTTELLDNMKLIPGTKFSDVTAAQNFSMSQFDVKEKRSPDYSAMGILYGNIHAGVGTGSDQLSAVFEAAGNHELGTGKTGVDNMNALIAKIEQYENNSDSLRGEAVGLYRTSLNTRYNDATGGLLKGINPLMQRVKIDANDKYNALVLRGMPGEKALDEVIREFDPIVSNFPEVDEKELKRRAQSDFTGQRVQPVDIEDALEAGDTTAFIGMTRYSLENRIGELLENGDLSSEQVIEFGTLYNQ